MADIQYYDGRFTTEQGNLVYHNFVNIIPKKAPYCNNSFRSLFTQGLIDKGDKQQYFVTKRQGFKRIITYNVNGTPDSKGEWFFKDRKIMNGDIYYFAVNKNKTKCRIYKQFDVEKERCYNTNLSDVEDGSIVNITNFLGEDSFPFNPCLYDRFLETSHTKGKIKDFGSDGVIRTQRVDDTYFSCIYNNDGTPINGVAGDYVYITLGGGVTGYLSKIAGKAGDLPTGSMTLDPNALMIEDTWVPGIDMTNTMGEIMDDKTQLNIQYRILPDYGLSLHFITDIGLVHLEYDESSAATFQYSIAGNTVNKNITSISNYSDSTTFLDTQGIMSIGGIGYNKFVYSPSNNVITNGLYYRLQEFMGYLILIGKDNLAYYIFDETRTLGRLINITNINGVYGFDSYKLIDDKFFMIRKTKDFYEMGLNPGYSGALPSFYFTYMNNFLNTDLGMLDRTIDECNLDFADNQTIIFINNGMENLDGTTNTKVLIFDRYYNVRYKRYVSGCFIDRYIEGIYLGDGIYKNIGKTDDGKDITQIVTMLFGDQTHSANKNMLYVKFPIGYNSYIENGKTFFVSHVENSGWHYETVYGNWGRLDYVNNIMKLKINDNIDNQTLNQITNYPIDIIINGAKGVNMGKEVGNTINEFQEYLGYNFTEQQDSDEENTFSVSKYGVIKFPLGHFGEVFTFEIVATGNNVVEFGGFFLGFQYTDIDIERLENTATFGTDLGDLTIDSGYTAQENINAPDTILDINP